MNLVADENIDQSLVDRLRREGHSLLYIAEIDPGVDDATILRQANERKALLLTEDKDFGELVFRQQLVHAGVVLIRLAGLHPANKADIVASILEDRGREISGAFSVIAPGALRIRRGLE